MSPSIIGAIQMNGGSWESTYTSSNTSADPGGPNTFALSIEVDNAAYGGSSITGTCDEIRAAIKNSDNWTTSNTVYNLIHQAIFYYQFLWYHLISK